MAISYFEDKEIPLLLGGPPQREAALPDPTTCPAQVLYRRMVIKGRLETVRYEKVAVARPTLALRQAVARCTTDGRLNRAALRALLSRWPREEKVSIELRWIAEGELRGVMLAPSAGRPSPRPPAPAAPPPPAWDPAPRGHVDFSPPLSWQAQLAHAGELKAQAAELRRSSMQGRCEARQSIAQARLLVAHARALGAAAPPIFGAP